MTNVLWRVITRGQHRAKEEENKEESPKKKALIKNDEQKTKSRRRRLRSKVAKCKKSSWSLPPSFDILIDKLRKGKVQQPMPKINSNDAVSKVSKSGSMLVEKVNKHFDAIMKVHESHITTFT